MAEENITLSRDQLAGLAVEYWRLSSALGGGISGGKSVQINYAIRKIGDFLKSCELEIRSLDGQPYDAGLAARVIDTINDPSLSDSAAVITETVSPMILHRGNVIKSAEIVIARKLS